MKSSFENALSLLTSWRNSSLKLAVFFRNHKDGWVVSAAAILSEISVEETDNEPWLLLTFDCVSIDLKVKDCVFSIFEVGSVSAPITASAIEAAGFISSKAINVTIAEECLLTLQDVVDRSSMGSA